MRHAVVNHSIFVDECGFNIWTARSHAQARVGEKAYGQVCGQFLMSNTQLIVILYAIDCLLVLMINHCARLKVYLLSLIVQRCNCLSVDAIEC